MIVLNKKQLEILKFCVSKNNPKHELDYIYVDRNYIVSTNTKVLVRIKHNENIEEPFFVKNILGEQALKIKGANGFLLSKDSIKVLDVVDDELITFSYKSDTGKYPDYNRVFSAEDKYKSSEKFLNDIDLRGILSINKVAVNSKLIPKLSAGEVFFTIPKKLETVIPVLIKTSFAEIVIMPTYELFDVVWDEEMLRKE